MQRELFGALIAVALVITACGGNGTDGAGAVNGGEATEAAMEEAAPPDEPAEAETQALTTDDTTRETTDARTREEEEEEEVLAAYEAAIAAANAAFEAPDPDHPDLLATHSGRALTELQRKLRRLSEQGVSTVGESKASPKVRRLEADTAIVRSCYQEWIHDVDTATGEPVTEEAEILWHGDVHMERIDGAWKVVREELLEESCQPR